MVIILRCLICNSIYYEKRDLRTLFRTKPSFRCQSCEKKYLNVCQYETIPIERFLLHRYYFFEEEVQFTIDAFDDHYRLFLQNTLEEILKNGTLIIVESLSDELFQVLDLLKFSHIYVYCLYVLKI